MLQSDNVRQTTRGRLKIFFGAAAGVGKTYAMLEAARSLSASRIDLVVGYVESHGRLETERLLTGLEQLPLLEVDYRGIIRAELDLDAALTRHPAILLVDELAHANLVDGQPRQRHPKRWQDIDELLAAGIDVWTTVNIQHLESLNDVVAGITGTRQRETIPDRLFDQADDIQLIDLPSSDLLTRLRTGKVYSVEHPATDSWWPLRLMTKLNRSLGWESALPTRWTPNGWWCRWKPPQCFALEKRRGIAGWIYFDSPSP